MSRTKYNIGYTEFDLSEYQSFEEFANHAIIDDIVWYDKANQTRKKAGVPPLDRHNDANQDIMKRCQKIWDDYKSKPPVPTDCQLPGSCWCRKCDPQSYG